MYEAVATLESSGRPATRAEIVAVSDLDDQTAGRALEELTEYGALLRTQADAGEVYELARRGWSVVPDPPVR